MEESGGESRLSGGSVPVVRDIESAWHVHEFEVRTGGGEAVCACSALAAGGALLLSVYGAGERRLGEAALGVPAAGAGECAGQRRAALATLLVGSDSEPAALTLGLARRLAAALHRPVYVFCGATFDRFTLPLLERGLITEIRRWDTMLLL